MKAALNAHELYQSFVLVSKEVRGKEARQRARALLVFGGDGVCVNFNDLSASCKADISEPGTYALNPFTFRALLQTFGNSKIELAIDKEGVVVGPSRLAHLRVHGRFDNPEEVIETWRRYRSRHLARQQSRTEKQTTWTEAYERAHQDKLLDARYVAFKRTDGGIEHGAAVLKYEKGEPGSRRVFVKTKDFQEVWINESEIVSYGPDPKLTMD